MRHALDVVGVLVVYKGDVMNIHLERFLVGLGTTGVLLLTGYGAYWLDDNIHKEGWRCFVSRTLVIILLTILIGAFMYFFGGLLLSNDIL